MRAHMNWTICLLAGLLVGFVIVYGLLPKESGILIEGQIRQIIREDPGGGHFEAKPDTLEFVSFTLQSKEGREVWVVRYKCGGRPSLESKIVISGKLADVESSSQGHSIDDYCAYLVLFRGVSPEHVIVVIHDVPKAKCGMRRKQASEVTSQVWSPSDRSNEPYLRV